MSVVVASCAALAVILLAPSGASAIPICPGNFNFPPNAEFTWAPASPYSGQAVEFDGSASEPAVHEFETYENEECVSHTTEYPITEYKWEFGEAGEIVTSTSPEATHHFPSAAKYKVKLTVKASNGSTNSETQEVTIAKPATPLCLPAMLEKTTSANTAVEVTFSCVVPPESAAATYQITDPPEHGTLSGLNETTGAVTYTPNTGYSGEDKFGYKAINEGGYSAAMVTVQVSAPPAPVCQSVSASAAGVAVQISLNCSTTAAGFADTYSVVANPSHGTLSGLDAAAGTVTYTPNAGYSGPDSFTYTATNAGGTGNTATVSITDTAKSSGGGGGGGGGGLPSAESGGKCTDSSFTFGAVKLNRKKGTATLPVNVRCKGSLKLTGKGVKPFSATAQSAGTTVKLKVVPTGKAKRKLDDTGKVKVKVSVTFDPTAAGSSSTATKAIKLLKR